MAKKKAAKPDADPAAAFLADVQKVWGKSIVSGDDADPCPVVPTGILPIDHYLLHGGLPLGRIGEIYSPEGVGKTALVYHMLGAVQRAGGIAILAATEPYDLERARVYGVDTRKLIVEVPDTLEESYELIETLIAKAPKKVPLVIGWDSLEGTEGFDERKKGVTGKVRTGGRAAINANKLRIIHARLRGTLVHLAIVNQVRQKIGVMFGNPDTTPGGNALKHYASYRWAIYPGSAVKADKDHVGKWISIQAAKTRYSPPWRKVKVLMNYATGFDTAESLLNLARTRGVVGRDATYDEALAACQEIDWKFTVGTAEDADDPDAPPSTDW